MNFKFHLTNNKGYNEVGQQNPIRWKTLYREADGSFTDQSGWWKCKDFLNDTVAFFKEGSVFSIYGYDNKIKKNDEGVYLLLRYIRDKKTFFHNMEVMNKQLAHDLGCQVLSWDVENDQPDEVVIMIPNTMWETTYRISMVTMVIRLCNWGHKYETWADFWGDKAPIHNFEHAFTPLAKKNAAKLGFKVQEKFNKYWWYFSKDHNSATKPGTKGLTIHNNGVSEWSRGMSEA